jgi:predicted porin
MAAPATALADAVLYGKIHAAIDYVDVDQNAVVFGPGTVPGTSVPVNGGLLVPDTVYVTEDDNGVPIAAQVLPGNAEFVVPNDGFLIVNGEDLVGVAEGTTVLPPKTEDFTGWDLNTYSSRLGVKGSEDLGGGLKAIYQLEFEIPMLNTNTDIADNDRGRIRMRNSYVGLEGNFGTFLVGRHDTPLKISTATLDLFNDTIADYKAILGFQDLRADNTITYMTPNWSGFQFMASVIPSGGETPIGTGVPGDNPDGLADAWSIAGIYKNGPFYVSAAYERLGEDHWKGFEDFDSNDNLQYLGYDDYGRAEDWDRWRIGLGLLDWNGFTLAGLYEANTNVLGAPEDSDMDIWQIQAAYEFGNNAIKAAYGQNDVDSCVGEFYSSTCAAATQALFGVPAGDVAFINNRDFDNWTVGFDHYFSKRTTAYLLYTSTESDQEGSDWSAFSLGMIHSF